MLHTFTSANATHRLLQPDPRWPGARGIWHATMDLYLNRFLNAPPARQPTVDSVADLPPGDALLDRLLALTDERQRVEEAAATTFRYALEDLPEAPLLAALAETLLREDGEFHSYQMYGVRGASCTWNSAPDDPELAHTVLVAMAATSPATPPPTAPPPRPTGSRQAARRRSAGGGLSTARAVCLARCIQLSAWRIHLFTRTGSAHQKKFCPSSVLSAHIDR